MKILVTGGAGYIGSHLVRMLLDGEHEVVVLDQFYYGRSGLEAWKDHPSVTIYSGEICNVKDVVRATKGVDVIIALAAIVGDPACELDPDETINSNYESTKVLIEIAKRQNVKRLVFASSCSVYGANSDLLLNEGSWLNPVSLYAKTRIMSEKLLLAQEDELEVVILRLATVCGVSDRMRFDLEVNILCAKAFFEKAIHVYGKDQYRPLVHAQDAARAFLTAATADRYLVSGQIFNVGTNKNNFTIGEIADAVCEVFSGVKVLYKEVDDRRNYRVSFDKINSILKFESKFNLLDSVKEIKNYLLEHPDIDYLNDIFYNVKYLYKAQEMERLEGQPLFQTKISQNSPA